MIILKKQQIGEMIRHSIAGLPNESCGLIAGTVENDCKTIERVYLLRNIDESPEHFSMDVREQFAAVADMRKNGWKLIGNFHSHPQTPSRPSQEDIRLAFDPSLSYLILSLANRREPVLNSFLIRNQSVEKEEIKSLE
ncbi:M67 family metallopeptidase [Caproiciproducens sp. CPB-2]|uniref:M67 family metallopeptidase n=1 Tax=unclassified Caproiciproducens TaxID=2643836 RepID=UPI0023DC8D2C|nr:M67 family metallopeptidase [Caproiciproducens sp. CPB-2]MDF1493418.1 M67 family metallopeptidase [Caproiciproducens sp. CPB-2]